MNSDADTSVVNSSTEDSESETLDSDYEPLKKMQKLSNFAESKSGIQHQIYATLSELQTFLLDFAITFQIPRPPIIVIETKNVLFRKQH